MLQIGVAQNNARRVRSQFEREFFDSGDARDSLADFATAGETDFARARIGAKQIADLAAGAGQALQRVGRDSGFEHNFDNPQSRQRRLARGL